jgi:hypothetical protein
MACKQCGRILELYETYTQPQNLSYAIGDASKQYISKIKILCQLEDIIDQHLDYCPIKREINKIHKIHDVLSLQLYIVLQILSDDLYFIRRNREFIQRLHYGVNYI